MMIALTAEQKKQMGASVLDDNKSEADIASATGASVAQVARCVYEELGARGRHHDAAAYGQANAGAVYREGAGTPSKASELAAVQARALAAPAVAGIAGALDGTLPAIVDRMVNPFAKARARAILGDAAYASAPATGGAA